MVAIPTTLFFYFALFSSSISAQSSPSTIQLPRSDRFEISAISVKDYGATGNGESYDTRSIQKAIDACVRAGGGRVRFPAGSYLTGTIFLRTGVVLEVEKGARILGGAEEGDYPADARRWYVVLAENATDVGITGGGEINGQGWKFVERMDPRKNVMVSWNKTRKCYGDECRPRLVGFLDSRNVRVWNVNLIEPAYWWCVRTLSLSLSHCPFSFSGL